MSWCERHELLMANNTAKKSKGLKNKNEAKAKPVKKPVKSAVKPVASSKKIPAKSVSKTKPVKPVEGKVTKKITVSDKPAATRPQPKPKSPIEEKVLQQLKDALIKMRDRLTGQISSQSDDSLKYVDDTSSEDRTDDFDREFALNLVSSEHDSVFEINNALRRIAEGTYGICDGCGCAIEKPRLHALPFARMCIRCQSEQEKGRTRFRPFGDTIAQGVEQTPEVTESEEVE